MTDAADLAEFNCSGSSARPADVSFAAALLDVIRQAVARAVDDGVVPHFGGIAANDNGAAVAFRMTDGSALAAIFDASGWGPAEFTAARSAVDSAQRAIVRDLPAAGSA